MGEPLVQHGMHCTVSVQPLIYIPIDVPGHKERAPSIMATCEDHLWLSEAARAGLSLCQLSWQDMHPWWTHHILDASLLVHHGSEHQLPPPRYGSCTTAEPPLLDALHFLCLQ